jgi:hypothetical protein
VRRSAFRLGIPSVALAARLVAASFALICALACLSASALANNLFSLDSTPEANAVIVTEAAGTAYVAWEHAPEPDITMFCKIPRGGTCTSPLVLPSPDDESVTQAFPVLGTRPGVVYVVGPRYVSNDTLIWTSTNGGASFSAPKKIDSYGGKTGIDDILLNPNRTATEKEPTADFFDIASTNPGFAFGELSNTLKAPAEFSFASPGPFVDEGSLGFTTGSHFPVTTFFNLATHDEVHYYVNTGSPADEEKHWSAEKFLSEGYGPRLASGPSGLFVLSSDFVSGEENPAVLELRRFNEGTGTFEGPTPVATDLAQDGLTSEIFENPETGYLYIVWPVSSNGSLVLHIEESTDGGASFHGEREVAVVNGPFFGPPRLAVASDGRGWLSWRDEFGDEVANLATNTIVSTSLSGGGQSGASITVPQGTPVTDTASIGGSGGSSASGSVSYEVFANSSCAGAATSAGSGTVSGGAAGGSSAGVAAALAPGKYYWRASYGGDASHEGSTSPCGSEVLTILAPTSTSTVQSGGGISGASLTVPQGTAVADQAHISGLAAASAGGTVSYNLYKNNKCTQAATAGSVAGVAKGVAAPSAPVKPGPGTYYWVASYSGDAAHTGSASVCGTEVLVVAHLDSSIGLPSTKICLSRRKFVVHPRAPKGVKLVSVVIQINGRTVKTGKLSKDKTTVSLVGLPKGTFRVSLITKSSKGKIYEDIRTYHTCVPGKHHKHKK